MKILARVIFLRKYFFYKSWAFFGRVETFQSDVIQFLYCHVYSCRCLLPFFVDLTFKTDETTSQQKTWNKLWRVF